MKKLREKIFAFMKNDLHFTITLTIMATGDCSITICKNLIVIKRRIGGIYGKDESQTHE